jgi:hypothetical protein
MTSDSSPKLQDIGMRAFRDMPTGELDSTKLFDPLARVLLPEVDVSRATPALIRESLGPGQREGETCSNFQGTWTQPEPRVIQWQDGRRRKSGLLRISTGRRPLQRSPSTQSGGRSHNVECGMVARRIFGNPNPGNEDCLRATKGLGPRRGKP